MKLKNLIQTTWLLLLAFSLIGCAWPAKAADITPGYTFSSGEQNITHTKLNNSASGTVNATFFTGKSAKTSLDSVDLFLIYDPTAAAFRKVTLSSLLNSAASTSGATVTNLTVVASGFSQGLSINGGVANAQLTFEKGATNRWQHLLTGNETGSNAGSVYEFNAYDDAGVFIDYVYRVGRPQGSNFMFYRAVTIRTNDLDVGGNFVLSGRAYLTNSALAANNKTWASYIDNFGSFNISTFNDALSGTSAGLTMDRNGIEVTDVYLNATNRLAITTPQIYGTGYIRLDGGADFSGGVTNNSTSVYVPGATQTRTAGQAVTATTTMARVAGSGGAVTLTSIPTIANGTDGQILYVVGSSNTNTLTFQDESGLAGSNLELGAATRELGLGDVLVLLYDGTAGAWVEVSFANN